MNKISSTVFASIVGIFAAASSGAENLIQGDAGAETNIDAFTRGMFTVHAIPSAQDSSTAYEGRHSVRFDFKNEPLSPLIRKSAAWLASRVGLEETPELKEGQSYTVSFYAKAAREGFKVNLDAWPSK